MFSTKRLLNKIKKFRKDNRITKIAFAKQIGISVSTLSFWEKEEIAFNPNLTHLVNIAKMFGVTPGELLTQGKNASSSVSGSEEEKMSKQAAKTSAVKETKTKGKAGKTGSKTASKKTARASVKGQAAKADASEMPRKKRGLARKTA